MGETGPTLRGRQAMCDRCVEWGGRRWHCYGEGRGAYYERTDKSVRPKKTLRLHRAVWESANGPVPCGHDIHHRDGDKSNNDLNNLECLSRSDHSRTHRDSAPIPRIDWGAKEPSQVACDSCGKMVERKMRVRVVVCQSCQYKRADAKRKAERQCDHCGATFATRSGRYCSQRCVNLATHGGTRSVLPNGGWRGGILRERRSGA